MCFLVIVAGKSVAAGSGRERRRLGAVGCLEGGNIGRAADWGGGLVVDLGFSPGMLVFFGVVVW